MTKIYFIRHGKPTYENVEKKGFSGLGLDFGELTSEGIAQARAVAHDPRLKKAELILSSPFTRALQTAAYINQVTQLDLIVEPNLHEWIPDLTNKVSSRQGVLMAYEDYHRFEGKANPQGTSTYETAQAIHDRVQKVLDRYRFYSCIIVVCHMLVIQEAINYREYVNYCQIVDYEY